MFAVVIEYVGITDSRSVIGGFKTTVEATEYIRRLFKVCMTCSGAWIALIK